ncbi:MAG: hypothetical protein AAGA54_28945 [Myxococcota bacterium]
MKSATFRTRSLCRLFLMAVTLLPAACGDDQAGVEGGVPESSDPRCASLCTDEPPEFDGAHDVCSSDSLLTCVDLCEARIADTSNLCAECLLEDAYFDEPQETGVDVCAPSGSCYVGLSRICEDQCWFDGQGASCGDEVTCEDAEEEYALEVARGTACSYQQGDDAGQAACHRQIYPRAEVTCEVEFEAVSDCADVCR